jgi:hypothetical protein
VACLLVFVLSATGCASDDFLVRCLTLTGCGVKVFPVRSASVTATVVDEETKAPLEGVVVVGKWPNIQGTIAGSSPAGVIEVKEVVTDAQGKFTLPGWWKSGKGLASPGLTVTDPIIYLYKAGYWPHSLQNDITKYDEIVVWPDAWRSDWDGKTISLKPMHAENWSKEQWKKFVEYGDLALSGMGASCYWAKYPRMAIEWERQWVPYKKKFGRKVYVSPIIGYMEEIPRKCLEDPVNYYLSHGMTEEEMKACCIRPERPKRRSKRRKRSKGVLQIPNNEKSLIKLESIKIYKEGSRRNEGRSLDDR